MFKSSQARLMIVVLALSLAGLACLSVVEEFSQAPLTTPIEMITNQVTTSISATPTVTPTLMPLPSVTPSSTATATPTEEIVAPSFNAFSQLNVASQERGGVVVEIAWILVGDKFTLEQDLFEEVMIASEMLDDKPVLVWIVFNISNHSGKGFHLHPRRGTAIVNAETIDLSEYDSYTSVNDNFDGTYAPGENVIGGGVWFGIEHSEINEINEIILRMHGPHFYEEDIYAKEYYIVLDLSDHVYVEIPDYLK